MPLSTSAIRQQLATRSALVHRLIKTSRLLAISLCGWLCAMSESHACSCEFIDTSTGFIHGGHLPSNARGVLFLANETGGRPIGERGAVVAAIPKALGPESFSITEDGQKKSLKVVVQRLNVERQIDPAYQPQRYYRFLDPMLAACDAALSRGRSPAKCRSVAVDLEDLEKSIQSLAARGKMQDVTSAVETATGLFRIGPEGGFEAGKTYTIEYVVKKGTNRRFSYSNQLYPSAVSVVIDGPLALSQNDSFNLELQGAPRRQLLSLAADENCSMEYPAIVQNLSYSLPKAYEAYRESMVFFTEQRSPVANREAGSQGLPNFTRTVYDSSVCRQITYGSSELGAGKELVYAACDTQEKSTPVTQVKGLVGLLEVDDQLHETPITEVNFGNAKGASCIYLPGQG